MNRSKTRRKFLQATTAVITGLAGCNTQQDSPADTAQPPTTASTPTTTDTPTETSTETPEETETTTEEPDRPDAYRPDLQPADSANKDLPMFQYSSERDWDNHTIDLSIKQEWHQEEVEKFKEDDFIQALKNNDLPGEPIDFYPNAPDDPMSSDEGQYDHEAFLDTESFEDAMSWLHPAWRQYWADTYPGAPSAYNIEQATSMEHILNQVHPSPINFTFWSHSIPFSHGMVMAENEDNDNAWIVETNAARSRRPSNSEYNKPGTTEYKNFAHPLFRYNAWDQYFNEETGELAYETMKNDAISMMRFSSARKREQLARWGEDIGVTDEWINDVRNQILETGDIPEQMYQQILPVEVGAPSKKYGVLGGTLDEPVYGFGGDSLEPLLQEINHNPETVTTDQINQYLE